MISISVWLIIGFITFILFRTLKFSEDKLIKGKYDAYGLQILIISLVIAYVIKQWFEHVLILQLIIAPLLVLFTSLSATYIIKQTIYDRKNKKLK